MVAGVHVDHIVQKASVEERVRGVPVDGVNRGQRVRREGEAQGGQDDGERSHPAESGSGRVKTAVIFVCKKVPKSGCFPTELNGRPF